MSSRQQQVSSDQDIMKRQNECIQWKMGIRKQSKMQGGMYEEKREGSVGDCYGVKEVNGCRLHGDWPRHVRINQGSEVMSTSKAIQPRRYGIQVSHKGIDVLEIRYPQGTTLQ